MKIQAALFSETLVFISQTTSHHAPEDWYFYIRYCDIKSHVKLNKYIYF
jgi:hypothetical protein